MELNKEIYKHGFSGACSPGRGGSFNSTFSVGCFQWLPKSRSGLKKSKVKYRIIGSTNDGNLVYERAREICRMLDDGWIPVKKSERV